MKIMDRRTFLHLSVALTAALSGCGGGATQAGVAVSTSDLSGAASAVPSTPLTTLASPLFASFSDPLDLTAAGEVPPTEVPDPKALFGQDPIFAGVTPVKQGLDTFDHVVAIQFENRAFDHMLGYLYPSGRSPSGQPFNGVGGKSLSNPGPFGPVPVVPASSLQAPFTDPAEEYGSVNLALFNQYNPPGNQFVTTEGSLAAPYNLPPGGASFPPPMDGFVTCFLWALIAAGYPTPTYEQYASIMQCFPPSLVPVMSQLAQGFAVCDNWHCDVPSETWCNRAFFCAGSSAGLVINGFPPKWALLNTAPTIFDALSAAGRSWTIYYDGVSSLTRFIHYPTLKQYPFKPPYFKTMTEFYADVASGRLPDYAMVEPRFFPFDNSYHPYTGAPSVKRGEILLNDIYQAIRQSNSATGSNYQNTLLLATFDEGGTTYDHAPPPRTVPPGDQFHVNEDDFPFDRLGQRIPAIIVSAWIDAGTVINTPLRNTSLLRTLEEKWNLPPLTARDREATSLAHVFNRTTPRPRDAWPRNRVRKLSDVEAASDIALPLNGEQKAMVRALHFLVSGRDEMPPGVVTIGDAVDFMRASPQP